MHITWDDLIVNLDHVDANDLLSNWRWHFPDSFDLFLVSAIGDMFLTDKTGQVVWLDVGSAELRIVAFTVKEFEILMRQIENVNLWFVPQLIGDLKSEGINLRHNQCYSYKVPPILGGEMELSNFEPTDLSVHFSVLGQLHQKVNDMPGSEPIGPFIII